MKTIKWILAAIILGTMASCTESDPIEETAKFTETFKGEWHNQIRFSFNIGNQIKVLDRQTCTYFENVTITKEEEERIFFTAYHPEYESVYDFDILMNDVNYIHAPRTGRVFVWVHGTDVSWTSALWSEFKECD